MQLPCLTGVQTTTKTRRLHNINYLHAYITDCVHILMIQMKRNEKDRRTTEICECYMIYNIKAKKS